MANVYWMKGRSSSIYQSLVSRTNAILNLDEMVRMIVPEESFAIKINLSEMGYSHCLPPVFVTTLFQGLLELGARPVVTDGCTVFNGSRFNGSDWNRSALMLGYPIGDGLNNQMMITAGFTNEEGKFFPADGQHLGGVELGTLLTDTGNVVVMSHVTAHPLLGISGAVYNFGVGMLTGTGKLRVHSPLEIVFDASKCDNCQICLPYCPTGAITEGSPTIVYNREICNNCLGCFMACPNGAMSIAPEGVPVYQESVVEAALTAKQNLRGSAFFVNYLTSVSPQMDDYPFSDIPFVPDLGILASEDPVALDWATYQMITSAPGVPGSIADELGVLGKGQDKIKAITGIDPEGWITYAEELKLGNRACEFLTNE